MKTRVFLVLAAGLVAACNRQESPPNEAEATAPTEPSVLSDEVVDRAELPVKEDFEEEAFSAIDEDNLESQVDALEREIASDTE